MNIARLLSSPRVCVRPKPRSIVCTLLLAALGCSPAGATTLTEFSALKWTDAYRDRSFAPTGWSLTFTDDFDDPSLSNLKPDTGTVGPWFVPGHSDYGVGSFVKVGAAEFPNTYKPITGGGLQLSAHRNDPLSTTWYPAGMATVNTSGQGFTERYGYFELYGKLPSAPTLPAQYDAWPAFWLLTQNGFDNPRTTNRTEIDVIEWYSSDKYSDHQTVHLIDTAGTRKTKSNIQPFRPMDLSSQLHSFGVKVTPTWTIFYLDRVETSRFPTVLEFTYPKYLLVNNAVFDTKKQGNGETTWNFDVQNVSVWQMPQDIIVDNKTPGAVTITGNWMCSTSPGSYYGTNYLHDGANGKGVRSVTFTPNLPCDGSYQVYARWTAGNDRATNVPVTIAHSNGSQTVTVDQTANDGQWVSLGTYAFNDDATASITISNTGTAAGTYVVADAVRFVLQDPWAAYPQVAPAAPIDVTATPGNGQVALSWTAVATSARVDDASPAITYTGTWTHATDLNFYNNTKSYSSTTGSSADYTFYGTGITISAKKSSDLGMFDVYIDNMNTPVATVDTYNTTPAYQQQVYTNLSLSAGTHTVRIKLNGQKNPSSGGYTTGLDYLETAGMVSTTYNILRATNPGGPYTTLATGVATGSYTDTTVTNGTTYYYAVSATNAYGSGARSIDLPCTPSSAIVIVDNPVPGSPALTGSWTSSTNTPGYYGADYLADGATGSGKSVRYQPTFPVAGVYEVSARWVTGTNRASNVPIDISYTGGVTTVTVNQQAHNGTWIPLGRFPFGAGQSGNTLIRNDGANSAVIADAFRFLLIDGATQPSAAPTGLSATSTTPSQIHLAWTAVSGATSYNVKCAPVAGGPYATIATGITTTSFNDGKVMGGLRYYYVVTGVNGAGESLNSNEAAATSPIIVDNEDTDAITLTGAWTQSTNSGGYYCCNYIHDGATGKGAKSVRFTPVVPETGTYQVYTCWPPAGTRATNVPFTITHASGTQTVSVNQQAGTTAWLSLGTYTFNAGAGGSVLIETTGTDGFYVIADAVKFVRQ